MKVLIVEDDETTRSMLERILGEAGKMEADSVADGPSALDRIAEESYDVVVLDYQLPETTGLEVLKAIRQRTGHPAVVFLTGEGSESVAHEALSLGAVDYLVKDVETYRELPEIIRRAASEWSGVEGLVTVQASGQRERGPRRQATSAPSEGADGLDRFLEQVPIDGLLVHDASGEIVLSEIDGIDEDLLAARSAALVHQVRELGMAAHTGGDVGLLVLRGPDRVLAAAIVPNGLQVLALLDPHVLPSRAVDLVRRAARLVRDELDTDSPSEP